MREAVDRFLWFSLGLLVSPWLLMFVVQQLPATTRCRVLMWLIHELWRSAR